MTKNERLSEKNGFQRQNRLKIWDEKKTFSLAKQPRGAHGPEKQQLNMALVNSKN